MEPRDRGRTVSLVLGSGGARGMAHIGVIRCLEEEGYQIKSISGCSIGALIGGVYGIGKLTEFETWLRAVRAIDIVSLMDISFTRGGLVRGDKVIETLKEIVGDGLIEEMPIRFTAVAADISREKEVWINSGPVFDAIRASISLPLLLTPFEFNGVRLVDGGVLNPVPIAPTFGDGNELTIAVNLGGAPLKQVPNRSDVSDQSSAERQSLRSRISQFIDSVGPPPSAAKATRDWSVFEVADRSFDAMQGTIARQKLAAYPPDLLVEIPRNRCATMDFDRAAEMIEVGYQEMQAVLARA